MQIVRHGIMTFGGKDEISWDELRALVEELIKRMLRIRRGLSEYYWTSAVFDVVAAARNCFAIGLHGKLLEVRREAMHVLIESIEDFRSALY